MHPVHSPVNTHSSQRLIALALWLATGQAVAAEVWVITDSRHPVSGTQVPDRVIELDAPQRLEAELSARLPSDPQRAAELARQRLTQDSQDGQQRLQHAYQGVVDAWSLGITTLPAVVVDRRYVIYGEPDLDQAFERIVQYRQVQP
jgi:integrating conjugative element protein (TIGR03757 family)